MKFGPLPVRDCEGLILAHALKLDSGKVWKKGVVLEAADIAEIAASGMKEIIVARLEEGDLGEDVAAARIAGAVRGPGTVVSPAGTGRVNLHAERAGLFRADRRAVDAINAADPGITLATLEDFTPVEAGRMVATVKIIPYAVAGSSVERALADCGAGDVLNVAAWRPHRVGVISTKLPSLKEQTIRKTVAILGERLVPSGSTISDQVVVGHDAGAVSGELARLSRSCDLIVVFGASAISDIDDVIPSALRRAGGEVIRFGMPVDPGNLLMLGRLDGKPVLGAPGCARSPAENGFDWVLNRLLAGIDVTDRDITAMGVGGLLMEISMRSTPRESPVNNSFDGAAIVLAAGSSTRMRGTNKLTREMGGKAIVRHAVEAALESGAGRVIVVTGHEEKAVREALSGLSVTFAHNPDHARGMSTSVRAGIRALRADERHALLVLGDMPAISGEMLRRMAAEAMSHPASIIVATSNGKRGNPVVWPRAWFDRIVSIEGDKGARDLLDQNPDQIVTVELGEAASLDIDTPEAYEAALSGG